MFKVCEWKFNLHNPSYFKVSSVLYQGFLIAYEEFRLIGRIWLTFHQREALKHSAVVNRENEDNMIRGFVSVS